MIRLAFGLRRVVGPEESAVRVVTTWVVGLATWTAGAIALAAGASNPVIRGRIVDETGHGVARVTVAGNNGAATGITRADGAYELRVPAGWSGTLTPRHGVFTFTPASRSYSALTGDLADQDFKAAHAPVLISGRVRDAAGQPLPGATLRAQGQGPTAGRDFDTTSNEQGIYTLKVVYRWSGKVAPQHPYYKFTPGMADYQGLISDRTDQDYAAAPSSAKPVADSLQVSTDEDTPATITLTGTDTDGQDITFRVTAGPSHGKLGPPVPVASQPVHAARVTYVPSTDYHGPDAFTVVPNDGTQDGEPTVIHVTVRPVNDAPRAEPAQLLIPLNEPRPITLTAYDPDGDALTYEIVAPPRHGELAGTPPNLTFTPRIDWTKALPEDAIFVDPTLTLPQAGTYDPASRLCGRGSYQVYRTLGEAAAAAEVGQTVILREGQYHEPLVPGRSGTPGHPITYRSMSVGDRLIYKASDGTLDTGPVTITLRLGEEAVITGTDLDPGVNLFDRDWVVLDGIKIDHVDRWLHAVRANHNVIRNCTFSRAVNAGGSSKTGLFFQDGMFNRIAGNTITDSTLDNLTLTHADRNVIEGNRFTKAAHSLWAVRCGNYNVIRNNYFYNEQQKIGEIYDCHSVGFNHEYFVYDSTKHNLVEGNTFAFTASSGNHSPFAGIQYAGQNGIIRNNLFYETTGPGLDLTLYAQEAEYTTHNRIFHNVFYATHFAGLTISASREHPLTDNVIKNNVFSRSVFVANDKRWEWYRKELAGKPVQVMIAGLAGFVLENNCLFNQPPGEEYLITYGRRDAAKNPPPRPLTWWQDKNPQLFRGNLEADPRFVDEARHDFRPGPDSPLIDAAAFLTRTTGAGEGTCLPVEDPGWFYDGFGIPGEQGDLIQLEGQDRVARIVGLDYETKTLRLDQSLTWTDGQGVARRYFGSRPDIGAFETVPGGNQPPIAALNAAPDPADFLAVQLDGSHSSDPDGQVAGYDWDLGDGQRLNNGPATLHHVFGRSGRYLVTLQVTDNGRPSRSAVACLPVRVGKPKLAVEPTACDLGLRATAAKVTIRNQGEGSMGYQLSTSEGWLAASRPAGGCENQPQQVTLTVNRQKLAAGRHEGRLRIDAGPAGTLEVPVIVTVPHLRPETLIKPGDIWRYFKGKTAPPPTWNQLAVDDSGWLSGPSGIGYSDDHKYATVLDDMQYNYVTFYARRKFSLPDLKAVFKLELGMVYDDGFVAYINGIEVARSPGVGDPGKPLTYKDVSGTKHEEEEPETTFSLTIPPDLLRPGENVLAIEVHNDYIGSTDAVMVPRLTAEFIVEP